jgi:Icc-related predicted phosphoesterase
MASTRVQYASDLHLDQLSSYRMTDLIDIKGDILVLCGDICHFKNIEHHRDFFDYVTSNFQYVIYVPGNHEYYNDDGKTMAELEDSAKKFIKSFPNLFYLNNASVVIEDILFTGTCLWCNPKNDPPSWFAIDITKDDISNMFYESVSYLHKMSSLQHPKHIMITHYPPIYMEFKKQKNRYYDRYDEYYQNKTIQVNYPPIAWIFGHTHENICKRQDNTIYLSNQRKDKRYNKNAVIFV